MSYFSGIDPQHGNELWRSDGTPEGTYRLTDLCPGICDGEDRALLFFQDALYFVGNDREHGTEIWRTDGTVGGEELLADACPGICGTEPRNLIEWRGRLWFIAAGESTTAPPVLWTSDGTPEGTRPVANLCNDLGVCDPGSDLNPFLAGPDPSGQGLVLWLLDDGFRAKALFRIDGTAGGTVLLHRFAGGSGVGEATSPLYFLDGMDLWTSNGTPSGTRFVRSLADVDSLNFPVSAKVFDGILYQTFSSGEWLRSDGTAEGTVVLAPEIGSNSWIARIGNSVFALTGDGIWRTEGTPSTTSRFDSPKGAIEIVVEREGRLFVKAYSEGAFLWTTDGTPAGTRRLDLDRRPLIDSGFMAMVGLGDGVLISRGGRELWRVDDRNAERLKLYRPPNGGSGPSDQVALDGRLLFVSMAKPGLRKLFSSDGTAAGTVALHRVPSGPDFSSDYTQRYGLIRAGDWAFFNAQGRLWATDGTSEGTRSFKPRSSFYESFGMTAPIGFVGGQFVYAGTLDIIENPHHEPLGDSEPWVTDGIHGTKQLINLNPFFLVGGRGDVLGYSSSPGPGVVLGGIALFAADDFVHGRELFVTDGTAAGTQLVADINRNRMPNHNPDLFPHPLQFLGVGSAPTDLVRVGSRAFFTADDGTTGRELWVSNGTRRGTKRVADLVPGPGSSSPHHLVAAGNSVYFFAAKPGGAAGEGLYRSDGTRAGTVLVSDLSGVTQAKELVLADGKLFFTAFHPETGTELWTSQGTPETAYPVTDLRPGPLGSAPQYLKAVGNRVIFAADDGLSGLEPWSSDGTSEGTVRLGDLAPGRDASTPGPFSLAGGQILFGADDGEHGRELWAIPLAELPQ